MESCRKYLQKVVPSSSPFLFTLLKDHIKKTKIELMLNCLYQETSLNMKYIYLKTNRRVKEVAEELTNDIHL